MEKTRGFSLVNYLIIETSIAHSFVLLCSKGKRYIALLENKNQASQITLKIESLLSQANIQLEALDFIGVGKGPGSFTGSRVGVLVAKTLNYALSTPLISFCSLLNFHPEKTPKACLLIGDAKSKGFSTLKIDNNTEQFTLMTFTELEKEGQTTPLFFDDSIDMAKKGFDLKKLPKAAQVSPNYDFISNYCEQAFKNNLLQNHDEVHVQYAFTP